MRASTASQRADRGRDRVDAVDLPSRTLGGSKRLRRGHPRRLQRLLDEQKAAATRLPPTICDKRVERADETGAVPRLSRAHLEHRAVAGGIIAHKRRHVLGGERIEVRASTGRHGVESRLLGVDPAAGDRVDLLRHKRLQRSDHARLIARIDVDHDLLDAPAADASACVDLGDRKRRAGDHLAPVGGHHPGLGVRRSDQVRALRRRAAVGRPQRPAIHHRLNPPGRERQEHPSAAGQRQPDQPLLNRQRGGARTRRLPELFQNPFGVLADRAAA